MVQNREMGRSGESCLGLKNLSVTLGSRFGRTEATETGCTGRPSEEAKGSQLGKQIPLLIRVRVKTPSFTLATLPPYGS